MITLSSARFALGVAAVGALLSGCNGGGTPPLGPASSTVQAVSARQASNARSGSWMAPDAKRNNLLYISDVLGQTVTIYSWPGLKLEGTITGFFNSEGLCVDKVGNVWVPNDTSEGVHQITEYAHAGTSPIANLIDPNGSVLGCSVDPTTGNLAVTSFYGADGRQGHVSIYPKATGPASVYDASNLYYYYYCGYDAAGNLFVDGLDGGSAFGFAELPHGKPNFKTIVLDQHILYPGGVQWDGQHLAVGDQYGPIFQFDITGRRGTSVGTTLLNGDQEVVQFWIHGKTVIGPNSYGKNVLLYSYPAGGNSTKSIPGTYPVGATVSMAGH